MYDSHRRLHAGTSPHVFERCHRTAADRGVPLAFLRIDARSRIAANRQRPARSLPRGPLRNVATAKMQREIKKTRCPCRANCRISCCGLWNRKSQLIDRQAKNVANFGPAFGRNEPSAACQRGNILHRFAAARRTSSSATGGERRAASHAPARHCQAEIIKAFASPRPITRTNPRGSPDSPAA